jgi:hypothetical protein
MTGNTVASAAAPDVFVTVKSTRSPPVPDEHEVTVAVSGPGADVAAVGSAGAATAGGELGAPDEGRAVGDELEDEHAAAATATRSATAAVEP